MDDLNPKTTSELIAALADGELDLAGHPEWAERLASEPGAMQQLAQVLQMRKAVGHAMSGGAEMRCPDVLRAQIEVMSVDDTSNQSAPALSPPTALAPARAHRPTVLARIGHWAPTAVAAVLLLAAGLVFMHASSTAVRDPKTLISVNKVETFLDRHIACSTTPDSLANHEQFGREIERLPGKLADYFEQSADGLSLDLSTVNYQYEIAGMCVIPGRGATHIIYRHKDDPAQAISLWIKPDDGLLNMEEGRIYVEVGTDLDHPVILWRDGGLQFYLMGDSIEDVQQAAGRLRRAA